MTASLDQVSWPADQIGEALMTLARASGMRPRDVELPPIPDAISQGGREEIGRWLEGAASWAGLEAEPVSTPFVQVDKLLLHGAPSLVSLIRPSGLVFIALLGGRGGRIKVMGPDHLVHKISIEEIRDAFCLQLEEPYRLSVEAMLTRAGVKKQQHKRVGQAILREVMGGQAIEGAWILRLPPGSGFVGQLRAEKLPRQLARFILAHLAQLVISMGAWYMVGRGALEGRLDPQWLLAWALLLLTQVPLQMAKRWYRDVFSIGLGRVLKQRLLYGALQLHPREIRHQGAGQLLGRVVESGAVGSMALGAALLALASSIELFFAANILGAGAGGAFHVLLLLLWIVLTLSIGFVYYRKFGRWTQWRLDMTHDLVERMVGHRTRLAQERRDRWHTGEDEAIERYLDLSRSLDTTSLHFSLWLSRGWMLVGLAGLVPALIVGADLGPLAIGLGGILLAGGALGSLAGTLSAVTGALVAWRQAKLLYHAAARPQVGGLPAMAWASAARTARAGDHQTVIEADHVVFRYRDRGEPVLKGCSLIIRDGDRVLLEGVSGGGKSTLVSILTGLRQPDSGLVLLRGLDKQTLGAEGWRQLVGTAPQFQENHVMTGTMAFNLLMGRCWPPGPGDIIEADEICRELGLGELLDRMPAGLMQIVGETGWRLSHGERSRLYIARALLQQADLIMLDESFAALDPENMERALRCVLKRAPTLLVVAHP
jgi:ATP-binding cassette subfamily B protein